MIHGIIYKYTNKVNGKSYIGQTTNPKARHIQHKNTYEDSYFHRAIKKYGFDNFQYEVLATITASDTDRDFISSTLDYLEITYIQVYDSYNNGYNLTVGGNGNKKYYTDEDRKKARNEHNKKYYEKRKEEINEYQKNYREEHKEEKNEYNKNYYKEHREKIIEHNMKYNEANKKKLYERQRRYREKLKQKKIENVL